ncbi:MAG TPA: DUF1573 domain-containing protein [Deltaproteobacteria bacterium]|nr:DUF1573 domain-containing protein [Deltaproteobacteria bacterium]HOI07274.1 DUF1573 domain-containing protein [Deltaproteobacteria bacterium]
MSTSAYRADLFKEIKVDTNDPGTPLVTLTLKAQVFEFIKVLPRTISFGKMLQGQTATREIKVENVGKKPFRITRVSTEASSLLTVTPAEAFTLKPGESRKLSVKVATGSAVGFIFENVTLDTDLSYLPQKKIYVNVEVKEKQDKAQ